MTLATWLLIFGAYFAFAFGMAVLFGRFLGHQDRLAEQAERLETEHPVTSISEYIAEREARANRAKFRHATRHGDAA